MNDTKPITLDSELILNFTESLLKPRFDNPQPTPEFHKELWDLVCSPDPWVAAAAPRGHAKSTAVTHSFVLALILFRERSFGMIISDTEDQSKKFLADIAMEFRDNDSLKELFGFDKFLTDNSTEIVLQFKDGHQACLVAKGSGQKVRGTKWQNKRPDFVICDDLENEEIVLNKESRSKFKNWFFGSVIPMGSDSCIIRVVGTVLHQDSLLENLLNDPEWKSKRYEAHNHNYTAILWPEKFPKSKLKKIRQGYINQGFPEGYYMEYLNRPVDDENSFFKKEDFLPVKDPSEALVYYAAADLAISQADRADWTAIVVAGMNSSGRLKIVDVRRGRWDSLQIIDEIFSVHERYKPEIFVIEKGAIEKSIGPFLYAEMHKRTSYPSISTDTPVKDKISRARSISARMRAGGVEFNKEAEWYEDFEQELLLFPRAKHDDQVDAFSWIGLTLDKQYEARTPEEQAEEDWELENQDSLYIGTNRTTGY